MSANASIGKVGSSVPLGVDVHAPSVSTAASASQPPWWHPCIVPPLARSSNVLFVLIRMGICLDAWRSCLLPHLPWRRSNRATMMAHGRCDIRHGDLPLHGHRGLDPPPARPRVGTYDAVWTAPRGTICSAALVDHGGIEVSTEGDAIFAVFPQAPEGRWPPRRVLQRPLARRAVAVIRCGCAWRCTPARRASPARDYVGMDVHRAARIAGAAHGGQVLISDTTANHVEDDIEHLDGLSLKDLGERQLKDIARPVRIYQLDVDGLPKQFPPLKAPRPERRRRSRRIALLAAPIVAAGVAAATLPLARLGLGPAERRAEQPRALRPGHPRADGRHRDRGRAGHRRGGGELRVGHALRDRTE